MEYISYYEGFSLSGIMKRGFPLYNRYTIDKFCRDYSIRNYTINKDGTVDVDGYVDISDIKGLGKIPIKFRNVSGYFNCSNSDLVSLEGCPVSVGGEFICSNNKLTSLKGCPSSVGSVGGGFFCDGNKLVTLEGCPSYVGGGFNCSCNELVSLEGCPDLINFDCSNNKLRSFRYHPNVIGSATYRNNELYDFDVEDRFFDTAIIILQGNPVGALWSLFEAHNNLRIALMRNKMDLFKDYDMVRGDSIILDRLNSFLLDIGRGEVDGEGLSKAGYRVIHTEW